MTHHNSKKQWKKEKEKHDVNERGMGPFQSMKVSNTQLGR